MWAWYPSNATPGAKFPLVPYLHGIMGGGLDLLGYSALFAQLASYGFIVAGTFSCNLGCVDAHSPRNARWLCGGLQGLQPLGMGWDAYYAEVFKVIDWARNASAPGASADPLFALMDLEAGVGIAGHSMGGQGAAAAASGACAAQWGVRAAVLHHPAKGDVPGGNIGSNMTVPVAAFTSSGDGSSPGTLAYMEAFAGGGGRGLPSALRNEVGWSHLEPVLWPPCENPLLATYTAAWLKVFLTQDRGEYYELLFGAGADSLCQHAPMVNCSVVPPKSPA